MKDMESYKQFILKEVENLDKNKLEKIMKIISKQPTKKNKCIFIDNEEFKENLKIFLNLQENAKINKSFIVDFTEIKKNEIYVLNYVGKQFKIVSMDEFIKTYINNIHTQLKKLDYDDCLEGWDDIYIQNSKKWLTMEIKINEEELRKDVEEHLSGFFSDENGVFTFVENDKEYIMFDYDNEPYTLPCGDNTFMGVNYHKLTI